MGAGTLARLTVTDLADGTGNKVELSVDWRAHDPVQLGISPVLHADDAVANKVCALLGRALPVPRCGRSRHQRRYTREQLLDLAANADHGFDRLLFADTLGALTQITGTAFTEYRAEPSTITDMRHPFAQWRQ
jgi:hypothetical protein